MAGSVAVVDPTAVVAPTAIIGKPFRPLLTGLRFEAEKDTYIRANACIGDYVVIGEGCEVGERTILDDFTKLDPCVVIGQRCLLIYAAHLCPFVTVGNDCIIGGFVGDSTTVGDGCRIFGKIVHRQEDPVLGWDDDSAEELAAQVGSHCFIGFQALVVGPVSISDHAYVAAGALVTKDVPARTIVTGVNQHTPIADWKGSLRDSRFFQK